MTSFGGGPREPFIVLEEAGGPVTLYASRQACSSITINLRVLAFAVGVRGTVACTGTMDGFLAAIPRTRAGKGRVGRSCGSTTGIIGFVSTSIAISIEFSSLLLKPSDDSVSVTTFWD